jgi:hypothetical protein
VISAPSSGVNQLVDVENQSPLKPFFVVFVVSASVVGFVDFDVAGRGDRDPSDGLGIPGSFSGQDGKPLDLNGPLCRTMVGTGLPPCSGGAHELDTTIIHFEHATSVFSDVPTEVRRLVYVFDNLVNAALPPDESVALIESIIRELS